MVPGSWSLVSGLTTQPSNRTRDQGPGTRGHGGPSMGMTVRDYTTAAVCIVLGLALAGCGDDDTTPAVSNSPAPQFEASACEAPLPAGQEAANVECGFVTVPEERNQ